MVIDEVVEDNVKLLKLVILVLREPDVAVSISPLLACIFESEPITREPPFITTPILLPVIQASKLGIVISSDVVNNLVFNPVPPATTEIESYL